MPNKKTPKTENKPDDWQSDPVVSQPTNPASNPFDQFDGATQYLSTDPNAGPWTEYLSTDPNAGLEAPPASSDAAADDYGATFTSPPSPVAQALSNAGQAGAEFIGGMIPRSPEQYAKMLYPPLGAYDAYQHMRQGNFRDVPFVGRIQDIQEAEKTPAWSKARWLAGLRTLGDVGMVAGAGKGAPEAGSADAAVRELMATPEGPLPKSPAKASPETGFEFIEAGEPMQGEPVQATAEEPILEPLQPVSGSGKFRKSYQVDKELGDAMEGIGAAKESGALKGEIASRFLLDELSPEQEANLGSYLVSRRLKTVNPNHPQILPDEEAARIESDPTMASAIEAYKADVKPDIEALRKRAGLSEEAAAGKEPEFISLIPKTDELLPEAQGGPASAARLPRTTRFAKAASGMAKEYDTSLRNILSESYSEAMRKARVQDFYAAARRKGLTETEAFEDLPPELQHDLRAATEPELQPSGLAKLGRAYQRLTTGLALTANPAELLNHMRRQLNIVAAKPPVGRGITARVEALVPYVGPKLGAFTRAVMDNMSHPDNMGVLQDIFDAGGGSARSFTSMYQSKLPGIRQLQSKTHDLLFGIPKGRGVGGWDLRMRVQLEKIRRAAEGDRNPQRIREFANQIGQYGSHPDWFIRGLRKINPYAATTLPMRLTELKQAVGTSDLKARSMATSLGRRAETLLRGTGGTLLGIASANYLLSGKWPWENDNGHEFDLNTGTRTKDGKTLYVKLRAIAPELSRPVSTVSAPELSRERTAKNPQYVSAALTGPANQALSLVSGPGQNAALTALTGKVPYFTKRPGQGPELMDVARLNKGESKQGASRGLRQIRAAVGGINPLGELLHEPYHVDAPFPLNVLERPVPGVRPFGSIFTQSYERRKNKP
jgi:hypothetical protein